MHFYIAFLSSILSESSDIAKNTQSPRPNWEVIPKSCVNGIGRDVDRLVLERIYRFFQKSPFEDFQTGWLGQSRTAPEDRWLRNGETE